MEWYVKVPLALIGAVELVIRAIVIGPLIFLLCMADREDLIGEFFTPWCFTHIQDCERKQRKGGTPALSRRQQRDLEYRRQELAILEQKNRMLVEIRKNESEIGSAFRPSLQQ